MNNIPLKPSVQYDYFRELPRKDTTPAEAMYIQRNLYNGFSDNDLGKIFSSTLLEIKSIF